MMNVKRAILRRKNRTAKREKILNEVRSNKFVRARKIQRGLDVKFWVSEQMRDYISLESDEDRQEFLELCKDRKQRYATNGRPSEGGPPVQAMIITANVVAAIAIIVFMTVVQGMIPEGPTAVMLWVFTYAGYVVLLCVIAAAVAYLAAVSRCSLYHERYSELIRRIIEKEEQ